MQLIHFDSQFLSLNRYFINLTSAIDENLSTTHKKIIGYKLEKIIESIKQYEALITSFHSLTHQVDTSSEKFEFDLDNYIVPESVQTLASNLTRSSS